MPINAPNTEAKNKKVMMSALQPKYGAIAATNKTSPNPIASRPYNRENASRNNHNPPAVTTAAKIDSGTGAGSRPAMILPSVKIVLASALCQAR